MKILWVSAFVVLQFGVSGCYLNSTVTPLNPTSISPVNDVVPGNSINFIESVAGAHAYQSTTVSGFRVRQSAGITMNKQIASTPNGYRAYLQINGIISAQELSR